MAINNIFDYENGRQIRVVDIGQIPWWVAKDICDVLEILNSRSTLALLDDDEKGSVRIVDTSSSSRETITVQVINESGLYSLILRSRKPEAKKFKKWITNVVLPSIRKHGMYACK